MDNTFCLKSVSIAILILSIVVPFPTSAELRPSHLSTEGLQFPLLQRSSHGIQFEQQLQHGTASLRSGYPRSILRSLSKSATSFSSTGLSYQTGTCNAFSGGVGAFNPVARVNCGKSQIECSNGSTCRNFIALSCVAVQNECESLISGGEYFSVLDCFYQKTYDPSFFCQYTCDEGCLRSNGQRPSSTASPTTSSSSSLSLPSHSSTLATTQSVPELAESTKTETPTESTSASVSSTENKDSWHSDVNLDSTQSSETTTDRDEDKGNAKEVLGMAGAAGLIVGLASWGIYRIVSHCIVDDTDDLPQAGTGKEYCGYNPYGSHEWLEYGNDGTAKCSNRSTSLARHQGAAFESTPSTQIQGSWFNSSEDSIPKGLPRVNNVEVTSNTFSVDMTQCNEPWIQSTGNSQSIQNNSQEVDLSLGTVQLQQTTDTIKVVSETMGLTTAPIAQVAKKLSVSAELDGSDVDAESSDRIAGLFHFARSHSTSSHEYTHSTSLDSSSSSHELSKFSSFSTSRQDSILTQEFTPRSIAPFPIALRHSTKPALFFHLSPPPP